MAWQDLLILGTLIAASAALYFGSALLLRSIALAAEALLGTGQSGRRVRSDAHPFLSLAMRRRQSMSRHGVGGSSVFPSGVNPSRKINQQASLMRASAAQGGRKPLDRTAGEAASGMPEGKGRSPGPFEASRSTTDP